MFKTEKSNLSIENKILNEQQIKWILIILMLLDHLRHINGLFQENWLSLFNILSRGVAPAFAYFAVEGIIHTQNLKKYNLRLIFFACIMEGGNRVLNWFLLNRVDNISAEVEKELLITDNILWTLSLGVLGISITIWVKNRNKIEKILTCFFATACWIGAFFFCEWGVVLIPFMVAVYYCRKNKKLRYISYLIIEVVAIIFRSEAFYFFVFPLLWLYNGTRGSTKKR